MSYLFAETTIYRLDPSEGYLIPVQLRTDVFPGDASSTATAHQGVFNYITAYNPNMYELIYVSKPGTYHPEIDMSEGEIQGVQANITIEWVQRVLPQRKMNFLVWETDEKGNKIKEFGYYLYIPQSI